MSGISACETELERLSFPNTTQWHWCASAFFSVSGFVGLELGFGERSLKPYQGTPIAGNLWQMNVRFSVGPPGRELSMASRLVGLLLILGSNPMSAMAQSENQLPEPPGAPFITHRAVEDKSLNLMVDYQAVIESEGNHTGGAAAGSFRGAQDVPPRVDWSRSVNEDWDLEPVLLNRLG
jgi:hypothetical protein